jgi:hypothetical protein
MRKRDAYGVLSPEQLWSLVLGEMERQPAFASKADRRAAWERHRDRLMANYGPPRQRGTRPQAWWDYDSPVERDHDMHEALQLYRMGELKGDELKAVLAHWAKEAEKARTIGFQVQGPGDILYGDAAIKARRDCVGIPDELFNDNVVKLRR